MQELFQMLYPIVSVLVVFNYKSRIVEDMIDSDLMMMLLFCFFHKFFLFDFVLYHLKVPSVNAKFFKCLKMAEVKFDPVFFGRLLTVFNNLLEVTRQVT